MGRDRRRTCVVAPRERRRMICPVAYGARARTATMGLRGRNPGRSGVGRLGSDIPAGPPPAPVPPAPVLPRPRAPVLPAPRYVRAGPARAGLAPGASKRLQRLGGSTTAVANLPREQGALELAVSASRSGPFLAARARNRPGGATEPCLLASAARPCPFLAAGARNMLARRRSKARAWLGVRSDARLLE